MIFSIVACSPDNRLEEANAITTDYVDVQIVLSTGGVGGKATRAVDNPAYGNDLAGMVDMENGLTYDNYIDPDDVTILVFEKKDTDSDGIYDDGLFIEQAMVASVVNKNEDGSYTEDDLYETHAILTQIPLRFKNENATYNYTRNTEFQLVALCNHGIKESSVIKSNFNELELTGKTLGWFIDNLTYSGYIPNFTGMLINGTESQKARIPMWGTVPTRIIPDEGRSTITGVVIPVLRTMAQVRIKLDSDLQEEYTLNGVKLYNYNTTGSMAATGNKDGSDGHNQAIRSTGYTVTYEDNTTQANIPSNSTNFNNTEHTGIVYPSINGTATESALDFEYLSATKEYVVYIPEYRNMAQGSKAAQTAAYIDLDVRDKSLNAISVNDILYFADYTNSSSSSVNANEWDLIRNDIYDFTITSITPNGGLNTKVRVMPWNYETMDYELSQNAGVLLTNQAQASYLSYTVSGVSKHRFVNETVYSANEANAEENFAVFTFQVKEPKGVRWVAHLSNPYHFAFTETSTTSGYGGEDETYTIMVKPNGPFKSIRETELYFTIETLIDTIASITPVNANNQIVSGNYGIANRRIHIAQVESKNTADINNVPFVVGMNYLVESTGTVGGKNGPLTLITDDYLQYLPTSDITTVTVADGANTWANKCNNGVVITEFKGNLYCMWQTSAEKEDTPDTYVVCSTSSNGGATWTTPTTLCATTTDGFTSSGGWLVSKDGSTLTAYINTWLAKDGYNNEAEWGTYKPTSGYTRYMQTTDGLNWTTPADVTMYNGNTLSAIFEQDPNVIDLPDGQGQRIICAGHFENIGNKYDAGLYVNPIYADYTSNGITGWKQANFSFTELNGTQSREMEPSLFQKSNGDLIMIFRDNLKIDASGNDGEKYTHRIRASISHDYGLTWTTPVETGMLDSKSKQCAGNLPDGTAFIVNNPVQSETRCPLVIHLSADGHTFNKAYIIRDGLARTNDHPIGLQARDASAGSGYCYPKAMVSGDYLYISYSTHKEDVEYTRIKLDAIQLNHPKAR